MVTKIIRQASINFLDSLYLRLEKSGFHQHVDPSVEYKYTEFQFNRSSSSDFMKQKRHTQYDFSPSKIIRQLHKKNDFDKTPPQIRSPLDFYSVLKIRSFGMGFYCSQAFFMLQLKLNYLTSIESHKDLRENRPN